MFIRMKNRMVYLLSMCLGQAGVVILCNILLLTSIAAESVVNVPDDGDIWTENNSKDWVPSQIEGTKENMVKVTDSTDCKVGKYSIKMFSPVAEHSTIRLESFFDMQLPPEKDIKVVVYAKQEKLAYPERVYIQINSGSRKATLYITELSDKWRKFEWELKKAQIEDLPFESPGWIYVTLGKEIGDDRTLYIDGLHFEVIK